MTSPAAAGQFSGAMTLLQDCVGGSAGERLLIVSEPEGSGLYDDAAPRITATAARSLGLHVYQTQAKCFLDSAADKDRLMATLQGFDHIIFFSRVGDQIRFDRPAGMPSCTMCYTLDLESLNSAFGTACYQGMCDIGKTIDAAFHSARHLRVHCPLGTGYEGLPVRGQDTQLDVSIKRFPMLVSQAIPAAGMRGRVALSRFLVGTGSHHYEPYCLHLNSTVFAQVEHNRIIGFEGVPAEVARVRQHYDHVSRQFGIEPYFIHSWHAGIHPGCHFEPVAETDIMRWSGTAFGNPRILHFHTCGNYAPGEISWNVLDPTIELDGVAIWEDGTLLPERLPHSDEVLEQHPLLVRLFAHPHRQVGLSR